MTEIHGKLLNMLQSSLAQDVTEWQKAESWENTHEKCYVQLPHFV